MSGCYDLQCALLAKYHIFAFIGGREFQHDFIDNIGLLRIKIRTLLQFRIDLDERDINGVMIQVSPTKEVEKTKDMSFASVTNI